MNSQACPPQRTNLPWSAYPPRWACPPQRANLPWSACSRRRGNIASVTRPARPGGFPHLAVSLPPCPLFLPVFYPQLNRILNQAQLIEKKGNDLVLPATKMHFSEEKAKPCTAASAAHRSPARLLFSPIFKSQQKTKQKRSQAIENKHHVLILIATKYHFFRTRIVPLPHGVSRAARRPRRPFRLPQEWSVC